LLEHKPLLPPFCANPAIPREPPPNRARAANLPGIKTSEQAAVFATNSGRRLRKAGDLDSAISQFRAALAAIPDYAPAHFELGLALQQQGKKDEARQEFQRANQLDAHLLAPADKY
jgi:tetratricopeptide (TPR) repeat protein